MEGKGTTDFGLSLTCDLTQASMQEGRRTLSWRAECWTLDFGLSLTCALTQASIREGRGTLCWKAGCLTMDLVTYACYAKHRQYAGGQRAANRRAGVIFDPGLGQYYTQ